MNCVVSSRGRIAPNALKGRQDRQLTSRLWPHIINGAPLENHKFGGAEGLMATYVLTVEVAEGDSQGLRLCPGIRLSQTKDRPAIGQMLQGAELELRRPDGTSLRTVLVIYGVSVWRGEDGEFYMYDDPADPVINLTIPGDVPADQVPPGTEVWLL
jgi:hypothetical protein